MSDSSSYFEASLPQTERQCGWKLGIAHFRSYALAICFIVMAAALGVIWLQKTIHNELRERIGAVISERLEGTPFSCELGDARWTEGKGLRLSEIEFTDKRTGQVVAACEQIFASSQFQLTDIISGKPTIDSLTIDQAELQGQIAESGSCNLHDLVTALKCDDIPMLDCPIRVRNSQVTFDVTAQGIKRPLTIAGINLDHSRNPDNPNQHVIQGYLSSELSNRLDFNATVDPSANVWTATCRGNRIDLNERFASLIQELVGENAIVQSLRGQISLNAGATGRLDSNETPLFEIVGRASNLQCLEGSLPHQIHNGSCEFKINNKQNGTPVLRVSKAECRMGYGIARANLIVVAPLNQLRWKLVGQVESFKLTERLVPWLTPKTRQAWHHYQPTGYVDANFELESDGKNLTRTIRSTIKEGSVSWHRFPFRISHCDGTIDWIGDDLTIDIKAVESQQLVTLTGKINNPGDESWSGWMEGKCDGNIPINEKLLQAFDHVKPRLARSLRKFNATGHVNGWGRVEKLAGASNATRKFDVKLRQATIRHENFNYPIYNVNGLIAVDNDRTTFNSIYGSNNNGDIECNGSWTANHGLQLRFLANNVLLNDELRSALPANLQKTWAGIRPSGTVDMVDMDLHTPPGAGSPMIGVTVEVANQQKSTSSVSILPIWFPYEMRQVTGKFRFENQRIEIRDFAAVNGRTTLRANGRGSYNDSDWRIRFSEMFASNIALDEELKRALPTAIRDGMEKIRLAGNLAMQGALEVGGAFEHSSVTQAGYQQQSAYVGTREPTQPNARMNWDLEFGLARASATIGVPVTDASGVVKLRGHYSGGKTECTGTLNVDSVMYRGIQVTSVIAPISIDNNQIGIGSLAVAEDPQAKNPSATARLFGGYVECDGQVQLDKENSYFMQAVLTDGRLEEFATETSMQQHDFTGQAYAGIRLQGDSSGSHSARGNGYISLHNARIYEVPVMLALLNVLRVKEPDRTAFDQGEMEFTVNGENIDFQKIELNGDKLSLIGQGTVNLDTEIDLDFYTTVGRNRWFIPVLTKLYHAGSQQVWWVEVDGTLTEPSTNHQVLPGLNDSLKKLFPEFAPEGR